MRRKAGIAALVLAMGGCPVFATDYVAMSGQELYTRFCAACHGSTARGDGPVAASFTTEMPDLTLLARRAGGVFPRERVLRIIDGRYTLAAHGTRAMPVWGEELARIELGNPDAERTSSVIIERLADHLHELQRPAER